jgi:hypothetical protein
MQDLKYFCLYDKENMFYNRFTVDLEKGCIYYNNGYLIANNEESEKRNIRLIFFRRHRVELTEHLKENKHIIHYYLGFQYNDKEAIIDLINTFDLGTFFVIETRLIA